MGPSEDIRERWTPDTNFSGTVIYPSHNGANMTVTKAVLNSIAEEQEWNESTKLDLCLRFIANQKDDATFMLFLKEIADEENGY